MNVMAMALAVAGASCSVPVDSIGDLACPIRYVDGQQGYFIGIEKEDFIIGTARHAVKNTANDVPQVDGEIENCSSRAFKCRAIGYLVFAIPKDTVRSAVYVDGPRVSITRLADGGWHGSATCSMLTSTGCAPQVDVNKPIFAYQYDVDPAGILRSVKIQNWGDNGKLLNTQNLVLVSEAGLRLK